MNRIAVINSILSANKIASYSQPTYVYEGSDLEMHEDFGEVGGEW